MESRGQIGAIAIGVLLLLWSGYSAVQLHASVSQWVAVVAPQELAGIESAAPERTERPAFRRGQSKALPPVSARERVKPAVDRAYEHLRAGDTQRAMQQFQNAYRTDPENESVHLLGANLHFAIGDYSAAVDAIQRFFRSDPDGLYLQRDFVGDFGDEETYLRYLEKLERHLDRDPFDTKALFLLAYYYYNQDEMDPAYDNLLVVLDLSPGHESAAQLLDVIEGTL